MTTESRDNYFMDVENWCLRHYNTSILEERKDRASNLGWSRLIKDCLETWITYTEYEEWVKAGGGDQWFQEYS